MDFLQKIDALEALYGDPVAASLKKLLIISHRSIQNGYGVTVLRLSTVGPNGTDAVTR